MVENKLKAFEKHVVGSDSAKLSMNDRGGGIHVVVKKRMAVLVFYVMAKETFTAQSSFGF